MIIEEELKKHWPNAVEGDLEHPELGLIHYWTGEQRGRIAVRFKYEGQLEDEAGKVFFVKLEKENWELSDISTFQVRNSDLKLIKEQSFRERDQLEQKYRDIIGLFMQARELRNTF